MAAPKPYVLVHGAFADVLRGMSPPAHTLLPGPEASPPGAAGGEA